MNETYKQLPLMPVFRTSDGAEHRTLQAAAKHVGSVTVDPGYRLIRQFATANQHQKRAVYKGRSAQLQQGVGYTRATLFKEIVSTHKTADVDVAALYGVKAGTVYLDAPSLAAAAVTAFKEHVRRSWDPSKKHVMPHSSGYDSRLISLVLKSVADEEGPGWLGDIRFYCFQPEIEYAKKIYDYIGWPEQFWFPVDQGGSPTDYYAPCADFDYVGRSFSEADRFWGGQLLAQRRLQEDGYLTDEPMQGVTGLWSDETAKWNRIGGEDVGYFHGQYLFDNPGALPGCPNVDFIFPFACYEWLQLITQYQIPVVPDRFKIAMIQHLDPNLADPAELEERETFAGALKNYRFEIGPMRKRNGGHLDQQILSQGTTAYMEDAYASSWYAQTVGPATVDFSNQVFHYQAEKNPCNRDYIKAAICAHLIGSGVTVSV